MTERSSGTRYSRKNSGGTPPSKSYPLSQQLPDRGSEASKCRPTKQIPLPTSATRRQRKQSFQVSSDKANSPSHVSDPQTEEAKLPNVVRPTLQKKFTLLIPKERRTSNDNNKIQRQTHPNPYINHNHHLPHHPQLQPNPCSSRTQRGHNPERVLPNHNPIT